MSKFRLPRAAGSLGKTYVSANNDFVVPVTLNETKIERMLVPIFERIIKEGRVSPPRRQNEPDAGYDALVDKLAGHPMLENFQSYQGKVLLDGWLRSEIVALIAGGKDRRGKDSIDFLKLLTLASYRSGYPTQPQRHRKADLVTYQSLASHIFSTPGQNLDSLRSMVKETALVAGLSFTKTEYPYTNPRYSTDERIDISALLELRFLEGLPGKDPNKNSDFIRKTEYFALPGVYLPIGRDIIRILTNFKNWSAAEIIEAVSSVLALRLYQVPIRSGIALSEGFEGKVPSDVITDGESNPSGMFFDFTQNSSSEAMNLARQSVATHLKSMNNLFWNMILSREVRRAANGLQPLRRSELFGQDISPSKQLLNIFDICREPDINAIAGVTLGQIRLELEVEPDNQDSFQILGDIMASAPNNLHALVQAIVSDRGPEALDGIKKWLYDTGGLSAGNEPLTYSIVRGTKSHPHTWYYSMTDSTLVTLINLCYVEKDGQMRNRPSLELPKLVERLELRFGVLVNKPPKNLDSPEARQAAAENYQAFIGKLRNLGYFHGLSDEFDVQYVIRPERASAK